MVEGMSYQPVIIKHLPPVYKPRQLLVISCSLDMIVVIF